MARRHTQGTGRTRSERGRRAAGRGAGVAAAAALAAAVALGGDHLLASPASGSGRTPTGSAPTTLDDAAPAALSTFDSCPALLAYYRTTALPLVGPFGLDGGYPVVRDALSSVGGAAEAIAGGTPSAPAAAAPATATDAGRSASGANATRSDAGTTVQVAGVDEADLVKHVGNLLLSLVQDPNDGGTTLQIVRTEGSGADARAVRVGRFVTGWTPTSMLVDGSRLLLFGTENSARPVGHVTDALTERTRIDQLDLSDPTRLRRLRTLSVDGTAAGARMVDGVVRLAVTSGPRLAFDTTVAVPDAPVSSESSPGSSWQKQATERQRAVVRSSAIDDWLPHYDLTDADGTQSSGRLVACADVAAPPDPAGVATLTMLTVDLRGGGLAQWTTDAVVAGGGTVYATAERTYVATTSWPAVPPETSGAVAGGTIRTAIHAFDTSGREGGRYLASGRVSGTLLNQFSMDSYEGVLRVATTDSPRFWGIPIDIAPVPLPADGTVTGPQAAPKPSAQPVPQSRVSVLRQDGDRLVRVGMVDGMGKGERIYAVRFAGPVGYVVTFRQTDPLYTLDLTQPTRPRVVGALKIRGYSAFLQPAGDGRVIGVGQDATTQGRTTGLQLSVFDVADPAAPRRISQVTLPQAYTSVEGDHHAFTLADGLVLVPFQRETWPQPGPDGSLTRAAPVSIDSGLLAVRLQDDGRLGAPTVLRMRADGPSTFDPSSGAQVMADQDVPLRSIVNDGTIWTVGPSGISAHDAQTLARASFTAFR